MPYLGHPILKGILPLCKGYSYYTLKLIDRADFFYEEITLRFIQKGVKNLCHYSLNLKMKEMILSGIQFWLCWEYFRSVFSLSSIRTSSTQAFLTWNKTSLSAGSLVINFIQKFSNLYGKNVKITECFPLSNFWNLKHNFLKYVTHYSYISTRLVYSISHYRTNTKPYSILKAENSSMAHRPLIISLI